MRRFFSPKFENLQKKVVSPNLQILLSGHYLACEMVSHLTVGYSRKQKKKTGGLRTYFFETSPPGIFSFFHAYKPHKILLSHP